MNTRKQVLIMSALLLMMLLITGVYAAWYPSRAEDSQEHFDELTAERGSILFARNCRLCHGDVGEGGSLGARLPAAPALDRSDLQGFIETTSTLSADANASATEISVSDSAPFSRPGEVIILIDEERMHVESVDGNTLHVVRGFGHSEPAGHLRGAVILNLDTATLTQQMRLITNTITCGRVGTAMPAWAQEHGGPLSDEQIRQLMILITQERWDLVKHHVDEEDRVPSRLTAPLTATASRMAVSDVSAFTRGEALRIEEERLRVVSVPTLQRDANNNLPRDRSGQIEVERGVLGTVPQDHAEEAIIYRFPEAPQPVTINQQSCGQTAREAAPAGTPELIEDFTGTSVQVVAQNLAFDLREIRVPNNTPVRIRLDNRDVGVDHNIAVRKSATDTTAAFTGSVGTTFPGPGIDDTVFTPNAAGNFFFRCDVHPTTMTGTFIVQ
jgi:hypothetical protein